MTCATCKFVSKEIAKDLVATYTCWRFPPQVLILPTPRGAQVGSAFPATQAHFTCDEYAMDSDLKRLPAESSPN